MEIYATVTVQPIVTLKAARNTLAIVFIAMRTLLERNVNNVLLVIMVHVALKDARPIV
jgi:hypothetical protein